MRRGRFALPRAMSFILSFKTRLLSEAQLTEPLGSVPIEWRGGGNRENNPLMKY
jgi:hypothetical protein